MSLIQHVSAVEGVDRDPDFDVESLQLGRRLSHTLSYDPIPHHLSQPIDKLEPVGAYEVPQWQRTAQVIVGVISCMLASGIVFGFAALKSVLVEEKVYRDLCTEDELEAGFRVCYLQDLRLNLSFTLASVTTNVSALVVGMLLDRHGPRICGIAGSLLLLVGSLCIAFAPDLPFDGYIVGQFLLAFGGTFVFVPSFQLSNAFPKLQGRILALVTGAFDASAAVFLFFRLVYFSSGGSFKLKHLFLYYMIVPVLILVSQLWLMPKQSYETIIELQTKAEEIKDPGLDVHDSDDELDDDRDVWRVRSKRHNERKKTISEIGDLLGDEADREEYTKKEFEKHYISGVWGALHGVPAIQQIWSPWFILITLLTILQMARMNFFIATIFSQYRYMFNSVILADRVNEFFDIALPIGGLVAVPFVGLLLDGMSTAFVLGLLVFLSTTIGVFGAIPLAWAAYANVCLFVLFRPLYYSAMSDYAAKVFGFTTFGTVYGTIICISGFTTFIQFPLQAITHDGFEDDPIPVNLGLAALGLAIGATLVGFVATQGRIVQREIADEEERRSLLSRRSSIQTLRPIRETAEFAFDSEGRILHPRSSFQTLPPVKETAEQ